LEDSNQSRKKRSLTKREKQFCCHYCNTGNVREAATMAGYRDNPQQLGEMLLLRDDISRQVDKLFERRKSNLAIKAVNGYQRLAFGSVADVIKLLYMDNPTAEQLENMDLYCVSEIKKPKEGAMEIKLCDRHKALEKLLEADSLENNNSMPFYEALQNSVHAINNSHINKECVE